MAGSTGNAPAAVLTMMPTGNVDASGTPTFSPVTEIPFGAMNDWTLEEMKNRFVVTAEPIYKSEHITRYEVTTKYTGRNADGTVAELMEAIKVHTGPMFLPFETDGKHKGKDIDPYSVGFKPDSADTNNAFKTFSDNFDTFVRDWVRVNNPNTPNDSKYFKVRGAL